MLGVFEMPPVLRLHGHALLAAQGVTQIPSLAQAFIVWSAALTAHNLEHKVKRGLFWSDELNGYIEMEPPQEETCLTQ